MDHPIFAFISGGKLYLKEPGRDARELHSEFAKDALRRAQDSHDRHAWKTAERDTPFMTGAQLWGAKHFDPRKVRIAVQGVTRGSAPDELLFLLDTDISCGIFRFDWSADKERRIMHRAHFGARDVQHHPTEPTIVYALHTEDGTSRIVTADEEHTRPVERTEGDSIDEAPSWTPDGNAIVFHSFGLGRNRAGYVAGIAPACIQRLDLATGDLETLAEDPKLDFLSPKVAGDGALWFIRRPHSGVAHYGPLQLAKDIVFFPFRMARAFFAFLNVFSLIFSQKPLTSAGGPQLASADHNQLMLRGRWIDARKAMEKVAKRGDTPAIVPSSWELVRRTPGGSDEVRAAGVVAYDLHPDGRVLYTNGTAVYSLSGAGTPELVERGRLVESLALVGPAREAAAQVA